MSPLLMHRDRAMALMRAVGSSVVLVTDGAEVRGTLVDINLLGHAVIQRSVPVPGSAVGDYTTVPINLVTSWRLADA